MNSKTSELVVNYNIDEKSNVITDLEILEIEDLWLKVKMANGIEGYIYIEDIPYVRH